MSYLISELNQMNQESFGEALGAVFEDTPAIAREVWKQRPFADVAELYQEMVNIVSVMSLEEKITLIRAHPDLGSKAKMAETSIQEQAGVGLDRLTSSEFERFQTLNQTYKDKFNFPFIIAVKNHTKTSILEAFERRLQNPIDAEITQALTEIAQIAQFRLFDLIEKS